MKKGPVREWFDALLFAVIAATLIRWATFEAFTILVCIWTKRAKKA